MQIKQRWLQLGKIERKGLGFLGLSFLLLVLAAGYVAIQRGWLESKVTLQTTFKTALGLREGTPVLLSGVMVGEVSDIGVEGFEKVVVSMKIRRRYAQTIYVDAVAQVIRPIAIGEKQINILPGQEVGRPVQGGQVIAGRESRELVDMISTGETGNYLETFDRLAQLLTQLTEGMNQPGDKVQLIQTIKELNVTLKAVQTMSEDMHHLSRNVLGTADMAKMLTTMAELTPKIKSMLGAVSETLEELTITLKGMQESFLFKGGSRKAREERDRRR